MSGYYRFPTICADTVVFQCEDDLWTVPRQGGIPRRLTTSLSEATRPSLSPDGKWLAFSGREEGPLEVYCMSADGGETRRLTYQGAGALVVGWHEGRILFASGAGEAFGVAWIWTIPPEGGQPERLAYGPAYHIAFGSNGGVVLGRHTVRDPARWKRYRGGTAGRLWIDPNGSGDFRPLEPAPAQYTGPMWIGERIYFVADPEGIANVYSCLPTGDDLRRHTHHEEYYCRSPQTDGRRIVYHAGGDLFTYDVASGATESVPVDLRSPRTQRQRKFVDAGAYLHDFAPHPDGHALAFASRGKLFAMANWEGAVLQYGARDGVRYRMPDWLNDGKRLIAVSDEGGEEALEIHFRDGSQEPVRLSGLDIGRPTGLVVSPKRDLVALTNHRFELLLIDIEAQTARQMDKSPYDHIAGVSWSPDGRWLAYGFSSTERTCSIKIANVESGETHRVSEPEFYDYAPEWDLEGKFLYFLSQREFNPVYDSVHFDLGFPQSTRLLLMTLKKDTPNPFVPEPRPLETKKEEKKDEVDTTPDDSEGSEEPKPEDRVSEESKKVEPPSEEKKELVVEIDFDGIAQRVVAFPYSEGRYGNLAAIEGKALFVAYPVRPSLPSPFADADSEPRGTLHVYDFKEQKKDVIVSGINSFELSRDRKTLVYRAGGRLRVLKAGDKSDDNLAKEGPSRRSGWVDLNRAKVSVVPSAEWKQMYREAWRLQRDYFWTEDMSGVDWERVYSRYLPLVDRIATRGEFSDLMWEMQGELGTSHCYEFGGDYRPSPNYAQGYLGADIVYDSERDAYRISRIPRGDSWDEGCDSPLARPGVNVREGDFIVAVGGVRVGRDRSPLDLLVNQAGQEVALTVLDGSSGEKRIVTVKALGSEGALRYRDWVATNRRYVHDKTNGRVGYVHIPNMGAHGYAEFHRGYLTELDYPALLVDVRYNGGGHVSPLILEKLSRRRIGYDRPRWGAPIPYPPDSVMGPMICVTNENAGSDGDIFSHCFKLMKLGKLVGKRTWGGVIGISPKSTFVDGGGTTQPEYSFWFTDVGWAVENYGTDPDIEVEYTPQDYVAGRDPQLDRAIEEIVRELDANPPRLPDFENRPRLTLPRLPR
jgi:tricorn protease